MLDWSTGIIEIEHDAQIYRGNLCWGVYGLGDDSKETSKDKAIISSSSLELGINWASPLSEIRRGSLPVFHDGTLENYLFNWKTSTDDSNSAEFLCCTLNHDIGNLKSGQIVNSIFLDWSEGIIDIEHEAEVYRGNLCWGVYGLCKS